MGKNTIEELREHLFGTLADLRDPTKPMEIERARAVAEVAGVIVDSARVEVNFLKEIGGSGSGFIPAAALTGPQGAGTPPEKPRVAASSTTPARKG